MCHAHFRKQTSYSWNTEQEHCHTEDAWSSQGLQMGGGGFLQARSDRHRNWILVIILPFWKGFCQSENMGQMNTAGKIFCLRDAKTKQHFLTWHVIINQSSVCMRWAMKASDACSLSTCQTAFVMHATVTRPLRLHVMKLFWAIWDIWTHETKKNVLTYPCLWCSHFKCWQFLKCSSKSYNQWNEQARVYHKSNIWISRQRFFVHILMLVMTKISSSLTSFSHDFFSLWLAQVFCSNFGFQRITYRNGTTSSCTTPNEQNKNGGKSDHRQGPYLFEQLRTVWVVGTMSGCVVALRFVNPVWNRKSDWTTFSHLVPRVFSVSSNSGFVPWFKKLFS